MPILEDVLHPHLYFPSSCNVHFGDAQIDISDFGLSDFNLETGILSELQSNEVLSNPNNLMKFIIQSKKNEISNYLFSISMKIY